MKYPLMIAAAAGIATAFAMTAPATPAAAADDFHFSFNTGDVAFAYQDGYWDHSHHWHKWRNTKESRAYHTHFADQWHDWKHTRDKDKGWHD